MGIIDSAIEAAGGLRDTAGKIMDAPADAQSWATGATPDKRSAEGMQDAARHAAWMADTSALIEEAAKRGMLTEDVSRLLGKNPAEALNYLARGLGAMGAMAIGGVGEGIGLARGAYDAGGKALRGDFSGAKGIISEAWNSGQMDFANNAAGALSYSQIKDPAERRAAIARAAQEAPIEPSPNRSAEREVLGGLVRRR